MSGAHDRGDASAPRRDQERTKVEPTGASAVSVAASPGTRRPFERARSLAALRDALLAEASRNATAKRAPAASGVALRRTSRAVRQNLANCFRRLQLCERGEAHANECIVVSGAAPRFRIARGRQRTLQCAIALLCDDSLADVDDVPLFAVNVNCPSQQQCVNPAHFESVTFRKDNRKDKRSAEIALRSESEKRRATIVHFYPEQCATRAAETSGDLRARVLRCVRARYMHEQAAAAATPHSRSAADTELNGTTE